MIHKDKQLNVSAGFIIALRDILDTLIDDTSIMAMINNTTIKCIGTSDDGTEEYFEIIRKKG